MKPESLNKINAILHSISGFREARVARQLASGVTGNTYLVRRSDAQFVLRIRSEDASIFVPDVQLEEHCSGLAYAYGLAPQVAFCDVPAGILLRHYIEGDVWSQAQMQSGAKLMALASVVSRLHQVPVSATEAKWPAAAIKRYEEYLRDAAPEALISDLRSILADIVAKRAISAVCHNDLVCANIVELPQGKIMFLDWEYSHISDPYFDLATIIRHHNLSADLAYLFLTHYEEAIGVRLDGDRLRLWELFYDGLQALWLLVLRRKGVIDIGQQERLEFLLSEYNWRA